MKNQEFRSIKEQAVGSGIAGKKFDFNEPGTRQLLEEVETWSKGDPHTHISASISPDYFLKRYLAFEREYGRDAFNEVQKEVLRLSNEIDPNLATDVTHNVHRLFTYDVNDEKAKECYDERGKLPDGIVKYCLAEFSGAVADVARQHFRDNVADLQLRFFPGGLFFKPSVESVVYAAYEGFRQAEREFPGCKGSMIFTFNRNKPDMVEKIRGYLEQLYRIKASDPQVGDRMAGIDLCGFTDIAENTKELEWITLKYASALQDVKDHGFFLTCHIGEYYGFDYANLSLSIDTLHQCIEKLHLDRIGHAIVLDPKRAAIVDPKGDIGMRVRQVLDIVKEREIMIESCPMVYIGSDLIERYADFPIHGWIKEGVNVRLGTDGLWTNRTSLSREAVKVLLSNPYDMNLDDMKKVVGCRDD